MSRVRTRRDPDRLALRNQSYVSHDGKSKCSVVTFQEMQTPEKKPLVTNPDLLYELGLFVLLLAAGLPLVYLSRDSPNLADYGIIFFNAGIIPTVTSVIAPIVRRRLDIIEAREILMYLAFLAAGITMLQVAVSRADSVADDAIVAVGGAEIWQLLVGGAMVEAGLVYFAIRSFLLSEAPEDRARRLEKEVAYLRDLVGRGISESYFGNFVRYVAKDMARSKSANNGPVTFQPFFRNQNTGLRVVEDVRALVVVVPILTDALELGVEGNLFGNLQNGLRQADGINNGIDGIVVPPNIQQDGFSRQQVLLKVDVKDRDSASVTIFLDVPTTLTTILTSIRGNDQYPTLKDKASAYEYDAKRFTSQLAKNLHRFKEPSNQDPVNFPKMVTVFEYEGRYDSFAHTVLTALRGHFLPAGPVVIAPPAPPAVASPPAAPVVAAPPAQIASAPAAKAAAPRAQAAAGAQPSQLPANATGQTDDDEESQSSSPGPDSDEENQA